MVGQRPLKPLIGVRIPVSQPIFNRKNSAGISRFLRRGIQASASIKTMRNIFESFFGSPTPESEKLKLAQKSALDGDEFRRVNAKITEYEIQLHKSQLSSQELADYEKLKKELEASTIVVFTPEELVLILTHFGINQSKAEEIAQHEVSHVIAVEKHGGTSNGYICTIFKDSRSPSGYGIHVSVDIVIPESLSQEDRDSILREVIVAPEEGGEMSRGDKEILSNI
jgi:hypothetical protein